MKYFLYRPTASARLRTSSPAQRPSRETLGLTPALQAAIAQEVRTSAYRIKEGKGVSNFGIGGCIARLTQALVNGENTIFTVSTFAEEVLGVPDTCISLPHMLGLRGASTAMLPPLDEAETAESYELPGADLSGEELTVRVVPKQADEFTCSSCFLVHHRSRLAETTASGELLCRDCVG